MICHKQSFAKNYARGRTGPSASSNGCFEDLKELSRFYYTTFGDEEESPGRVAPKNQIVRWTSCTRF